MDWVATPEPLQLLHVVLVVIYSPTSELGHTISYTSLSFAVGQVVDPAVDVGEGLAYGSTRTHLTK